VHQDDLLTDPLDINLAGLGNPSGQASWRALIPVRWTLRAPSPPAGFPKEDHILKTERLSDD
jgi:hypothetical protein